MSQGYCSRFVWTATRLGVSSGGTTTAARLFTVLAQKARYQPLSGHAQLLLSPAFRFLLALGFGRHRPSPSSGEAIALRLLLLVLAPSEPSSACVRRDSQWRRRDHSPLLSFRHAPSRDPSLGAPRPLSPPCGRWGPPILILHATPPVASSFSVKSSGNAALPLREAHRGRCSRGRAAATFRHTCNRFIETFAKTVSSALCAGRTACRVHATA